MTSNIWYWIKKQTRLILQTTTAKGYLIILFLLLIITGLTMRKNPLSKFGSKSIPTAEETTKFVSSKRIEFVVVEFAPHLYKYQLSIDRRKGFIYLSSILNMYFT